MDAKTRRNILLETLRNAGQPVTGTALAKKLNVSRQIIVGDIAIIRASGVEIYATPQGYVLPGGPQHDNAVRAKIACHHSRDKVKDELQVIIDFGGKVLDVIVEHPIYGEIRANLMLASHRELSEFLQKLSARGAEPLSLVTGGVHLHTVEVPSPRILTLIEEELDKQGILMK